MIKQNDNKILKGNDNMLYFKRYAILRISNILIRKQIREGFEILKIPNNWNGIRHRRKHSNKQSLSSTKSNRVEKYYQVQISLEKIKLTNKFGSQSLFHLPEDLQNLTSRKRLSLKENVQHIKSQNEKNIQEFNSKIQQHSQEQQLKEISQIIELQTFGQKLLARNQKKNINSPKGQRLNTLILLPVMVLIIMILFRF